MLGAGPAHALAPELTLRPVLTEIGGTVPVRGLYVLDPLTTTRRRTPWLARHGSRPRPGLLPARQGALA